MKISERPNSPIARATNSMPSSRLSCPKANRMLPVNGSIPTNASVRPNSAAIRPLTSDLPIRPISSDKPTTTRAKYSGGPNFRACEATSGPTRIRMASAIMPPMKEPIAATPSAVPARPCRAMG